jgi:predicted molibdopterin-dependent oxidoreductase YjgC
MRDAASSSLATVDSLSIPGVVRGAPFSISVNGVAVTACAGESVAAAMCRANIAVCRLTLKGGAPRGYYCGMGVCFECLVEVDGVGGLRACCTTVQPGMYIRTEHT